MRAVLIYFLFCFVFCPAAALAQTAPPATPSADKGVIRGSYGDWQIRCETFPGAQNEQCAMVQTVVAKDRPNVGLMIIVLPIADQNMEVLRIIAPLGVLLPSGLGLRIDDKNVGATAFLRCYPNGCMADARLNDDLLAKLRNGKTATFVIFQTPEEGIGIPVSLNGFGEGYDKMKAK